MNDKFPGSRRLRRAASPSPGEMTIFEDSDGSSGETSFSRGWGNTDTEFANARVVTVIQRDMTEDASYQRSVKSVRNISEAHRNRDDARKAWVDDSENEKMSENEFFFDEGHESGEDDVSPDKGVSLEKVLPFWQWGVPLAMALPRYYKQMKM